ncbi:division/cell wall cluster transcriptional repressor MraZ [Patescibacteria group bacterium]
MLIGHYISSITPKRRTALPSKFRKIIGTRIIVTRWYEGCLVIVGESNFKIIIDKLVGERDVITRPIRDTERFILGSAYEVETDNQGRFVVPQVLAEFAQLGKKIVFVGINDRIEVWDQKTWVESQSQIISSSSANIEKIAKI